MIAPALLLAALAAVTAAKSCIDISLPVWLTPNNAIFEAKPPVDELQLTNFILNLGKPAPELVRTEAKEAKLYQIAATYCWPEAGPGDRLQLLTHGIGFDRTYWDFDYDGGRYSYVDAALARGYSTLAWDRLGIGASSHGDAINEIQIFLEVAALRALTSWVRDGGLPGGAHRRSALAHVGHSFGSALTQILASENPAISDCVVLTGFSQVFSFLPTFAVASQFIPVQDAPALAAYYGPGYIVPKTIIGVHTNFFAPQNFDPAVLRIAFDRQQPAALGEMMTLTDMKDMSAFRGPVLLVTGERDLPFCGGNCTRVAPVHVDAPSILENSRKSYPYGSPFEATIIPGSGHALNLEFTAQMTYKTISDFMDKHMRPRGTW